MTKASRLHIDPPYAGESLSSVVSRVAQTYVINHSAFVKELTAGQYWRNAHTHDLDFDPPNSLESNLQLRVKGWTVPTRRGWSLHGHKIAPRFRTSYCPMCFEIDLMEGKTPYFRLSWASAWVTICWRHRCPLMDWQDCSGGQYRRLPDHWIHGKHAQRSHVPEFHLKNLATAHEHFADSMKSFDSEDLLSADTSTVLQLLWRAQNLLERPDNQAPNRIPSDLSRTLNWCASELFHMGSAQYDPMNEPPAALPIYREELAPLLSDAYDRMNSKTNPKYDRCIRNSSTLAWRRTYLWFGVRTLATSRRFSQMLTGRERPRQEWPDWWADELRPLWGTRTREAIAERERYLAQQLAKSDDA